MQAYEQDNILVLTKSFDERMTGSRDPGLRNL